MRFSDVEGDVFLTSADAEGRYALRLLAAPHGCVAEVDGLHSATVEVAPGAARQDLAIWRPAPAPGAVVDWIRSAAVPLLTPQAGHGFADMAPLAALVGDARVVALGEATHGSREIFQMKHRMLEYLVAQLGFTVFAIEANWPESEAVNRYVLTGEGDPAEALAGLYFWTWNTEEVLDLIRWMRQWNAVPDNPKVEFYGFDMQTAAVAGKELARVLGEIDRTLAGELEPLLPLLEPGQEPAGTAEQRTGLAALLGRIGERFASPPPALAGRELLVARQYVRVIEQYLELRAEAGGGYAVRDRAMADNTRWIADVAKPGARIVLWAHNGHVHDAETFIPWMGSHLETALGDAYLPVGFLFHHGSFQAIDGTGGKAGLKEFSLGAPAAGTLEDTFARAGWPIAVLDLRRLPPGPVTEWFGQPQRLRETGALFSDEESMTNARVLPDDFEAVIYLESTTRARPNPRRAPPVSE